MATTALLALGTRRLHVFGVFYYVCLASNILSNFIIYASIRTFGVLTQIDRRLPTITELSLFLLDVRCGHLGALA